MSGVEAATGGRFLLHPLRKGADVEPAVLSAKPSGGGPLTEECVISPQVGG